MTTTSYSSSALVWKIQTLNINVASLRYRCLFPLRYLAQRGIASKIYGGMDTVKLTPQTKALIFVKSFHHVDVQTCDRAYAQGIPIILDLCDNIFIEGYGADSDHIPAQNFQIMAQQATAIVTTGAAMKAEVDHLLSSQPMQQPNAQQPIVVIIPDGSESVEDIEFAFRSTKKKRRKRLTLRPLKKARQLYKQGRQQYKQRYKQGRRKAKVIFYGVKGGVGNILRRYGLRKPLPVEPATDKTLPAADAMRSHSTGSAAEEGTITQNTITQSTITQSTITQHAVPESAVKRKNHSQPAPLWPKPWPAAPELKTVLWFGNHGAKYGNFGMLNVLEVTSALERISKDVPLRLMIISNNSEKYEAHIAPLPVQTDYLPWHPRKIYDYIRQSDVVIVPNSQSRYSVCKSANRAVLSLSQGTPVVASPTPALDMLSGCVWTTDWEEGIREYLLNPTLAAAHVEQAQRIIEANLSGEAIAQKWIDLLNQVAPDARSKALSQKRNKSA